MPIQNIKIGKPIQMKKIHLPILFCLLFVSFLSSQNTALHLNGTDENLVVDHKPAFNLSDGFTIEAWIYAENWQPNIWQGSIVCKDSPGPDNGYAFRCGDNGKLSFVMAADNTWNEVFTTSIMNTEQWHHVAVVVNGTNMTLYIDGSASANASYSGNISNNTEDLHIGQSAGFGDRYFDGIIDEVRIWNVARTASEIANNISTAFSGAEAGLSAYFPMNEGTGMTAGNLVDPACSASFENMDESNWVGGYTIPDYDISVQPIKGVDVFNMKYRPILIEADLKNLGTEDLSEIEVTIGVNGSDIVTETVGVSIPAGANYTYQFVTPINLQDLTDPTIEITATHANDQNNLNNSKSLTINTQNGNVIRLFNAAQHNFGAAGQNQFNNVVMPASLAEFETLLLHINLTCPTSDCDPWDQPAKVNAITDNGTYEIARYITPYGIACGPWTVDVTDFKNVLTGPVNFHSYIQVWGGSGWLVTIDLELIEGSDPNPYYLISPLWETDYLVYGDPGISHDLEAQMLNVDAITNESHIRMTMSGHGQGNTDNAAEFSQQTHDFTVNGMTVDNHLLWKADCAENTCDDQDGNWLFARAGWCPGQAVDPYIVNTTATATPGSNTLFDYELQDYVNLLNTGYNETTHTEPHYRIWSYFVEQSDQRYVDYNNLLTESIVPTISTTPTETLDALTITVVNTGSVAKSNFEVSYFINNELISTETITETLQPGASIAYDFTTIDGFQAGFQNIFYGVVQHIDDENLGDNVALYLLDGMVDVDETLLEKSTFSVAPNPAQGSFQVELDPLLMGSTIRIYTMDGQLVKTKLFAAKSHTMHVNEPGVYMIQITNEAGYFGTKKLIITK